MIYAIQVGGHVKIGFSKNPEGRLEGLQTHQHELCTLIGTADGTKVDERAIHRQFGSARVRGEWFQLTPEIAEWIRANMRPMEIRRTHGKIGRPPIPEAEVRKPWTPARWTDAEKQEIIEAASTDGKAVSDFVRDSLLSRARRLLKGKNS